MASELDRKFDSTLAKVIGPGGRLIIAEDEQGRAIVANFPATLQSLLRTFCALNAEFLEGRLASFKIPDRFIFMAEPLPRLGTGKIDRVALKAQFAR